MELERRLSRKRHTEEALYRRKLKCDEEKERALKAIVPLKLVIVILQVLFADLKKSRKNLPNFKKSTLTTSSAAGI